MPRNLFGVTAARRVQREILRAPTFVEQQLDLVVADTHRIVRSEGHEPHSWALAPEEPHPVVDKRLEGVGDLAGFAQVVVQDQRHHPTSPLSACRREALAWPGGKRWAGLMGLLPNNPRRDCAPSASTATNRSKLPLQTALGKDACNARWPMPPEPAPIQLALCNRRTTTCLHCAVPSISGRRQAFRCASRPRARRRRMRTRSPGRCGHRSVPDRRNHRQGLLARSCGLVRQRVAAGDEPGVSVPDELRPG